MINSNQLIRKLKTLGVPVPTATLRLWASEDIISNYEEHGPTNKPRLKKLVGARPKRRDAVKKRQEKMEKLAEDGEKVRPGRPCSLWLSETVEQAAAVWAVRYSGITKPRALTTEMIKVIKRAAAVLDERPFAIYTLSPVTGPLSTHHLDPEDIKMKFVSEDCEGLDLFPGADNTEKADYLNKLVVVWVVTIEKVRAWKNKGIIAQVESDWGSEWEDHLKEIDFSQIDPWKVAVPCPWQIDKPARVTLFYLTWGQEFFKYPYPSQGTLRESDCDGLILLENGVDTREFFRIDVTDSAGWAKAGLEDMERKKRSGTSAEEQMTINKDSEFLEHIRRTKG